MPDVPTGAFLWRARTQEALLAPAELKIKSFSPSCTLHFIFKKFFSALSGDLLSEAASFGATGRKLSMKQPDCGGSAHKGA